MKLDPRNPHHDPILQPNYFEDPQDIIDLREAVKIARNIFTQKALDRFRGPEISPGNVSVSVFDLVRASMRNYFHYILELLKTMKFLASKGRRWQSS